MGVMGTDARCASKLPARGAHINCNAINDRRCHWDIEPTSGVDVQVQGLLRAGFSGQAIVCTVQVGSPYSIVLESS